MAPLEHIAAGREADILSWSPGRVVRLLKDPRRAEELLRERSAMIAAYAAGVPLPEPREIVTIGGRPGLVMERLKGIDLLKRMEKQPWKAHEAGQLTARAHVQLHEVKAPASLPQLHDGLRAQLAGRTIPAEFHERALKALDSLPRGDRVCHGDFHPGNLILTSEGVRIIDWPHAACGPPVADVAKSHVVMRAGALPDSTPRAVRIAAGPFRWLLLRSYERTYRARTAAGLSRLAEWIFVQAVARYSDGIPGEPPMLRRIADEALTAMELPGA